MRKTFAYFSAAALFCVLMLSVSMPSTNRTARAAAQEKCEDCVLKVQEKFDKCLAKYGENYLPCYDEYNEGIVHCYAHWCEQ